MGRQRSPLIFALPVALTIFLRVMRIGRVSAICNATAPNTKVAATQRGRKLRPFKIANAITA